MTFQINRTGSGKTLVFVIGNEDHAGLGSIDGTTLVSVTGFDWDGDLSPWPMSKVFKNGNDFAGHADELIEALTKEVFEPIIQEVAPTKTVVVGYSLAGLFSLYLCTKSDLFDGCASVSGSLWYKDWLNYLEAHPVHVKQVYLSLGDTEKKTKNPILFTVEECTLRTKALVEGYCDCVFESNPGNHMTDETKRILKGIQWLVC